MKETGKRRITQTPSCGVSEKPRGCSTGNCVTPLCYNISKGGKGVGGEGPSRLESA
jgi:hypothetical protein